VTSTSPSPAPAVSSSWTFLTNHSHVLVCLVQDPDIRIRDLADRVGITERAVQRILAELEESGVITKFKQGRRNQYEIELDTPLRHELESHTTLRELLHIFLTVARTEKSDSR